MTQCAGRTQKGAQCKREAKEGSAFCSIHQEQETHPRPDLAASAQGGGTATETARDPREWLEVAIGLGILAAIVLFRIRR